MTSLRLDFEELEEGWLSEFAVRSSESKGRAILEPECEIRTVFQRDRDRIIHSKTFRRLKHKTQVFISSAGDIYRTRLTHTLEVAQISRTIARALRLNEDLTEAIALGHDLGHTPFGHAGEEGLQEVFGKGFHHNLQSLRVVEVLEHKSPGQSGLNLTWEVRDGIRNHTGPDVPSTLEGCVVREADRIAYINHDIDDAIRAGIISEEELPRDSLGILGNSHGLRIDTMVKDIIKWSKNKDHIAMGQDVVYAMDELREFLFQRVYFSPEVRGEAEKGKGIVKELFSYMCREPKRFLLPGIYGVEQEVCDYIAGMTDESAIKKYCSIFIPTFADDLINHGHKIFKLNKEDF
jgi:dGTPase